MDHTREQRVEKEGRTDGRVQKSDPRENRPDSQNSALRESVQVLRVVILDLQPCGRGEPPRRGRLELEIRPPLRGGSKKFLAGPAGSGTIFIYRSKKPYGFTHGLALVDVSTRDNLNNE